MPHDRAAVLLDTAYVYARVNVGDQWHKAALQWEERLSTSRRPLVTTEFVLIEIADGLAAIKFRLQAGAIIAALQASSLVEVVPATSALFEAASAMYRNRADKDWGLTDCSLFVIMAERVLTEALTTDTHFQQAGYRAILLEAVGNE
jgi:predicted nucleic acid-binding protein